MSVFTMIMIILLSVLIWHRGLTKREQFLFAVLFWMLVLPILAGCTVETEDRCVADPEALYVETQTCMGMTAYEPDVQFIDFNERGIGAVWAVYMPAHDTVLVNTGEMGLGFKHTCQTDREALKHEFVHHILHVNGMADESRSHDNYFFEPCGAGVEVRN